MRPATVRPAPKTIQRRGSPAISRLPNSDASPQGTLTASFCAMPRFAAIDVGSNALRLRVIEAMAPSPAVKPRATTTIPPPPEAQRRDLSTAVAPVRPVGEAVLSGRLAPTSLGQ